MKNYYLYLYLIIFLSFFGCNQLTSQDGYTNVKPEQFKSLISNDSVLIIDVRTPEEYLQGHLNNAVNIDFYSDDFSNAVDKLNTKKTVFVYCRSGQRSSKSVTVFKKAGFTKIYNLDGGILGWKSRNLPIITKD